VHSHDGAAEEDEAEEIALLLPFEEGAGAGECQRQEEKFGDQLVLWKTLDELASPGNARLAEVDEEEERVEATGEQRRSRS